MFEIFLIIVFILQSFLVYRIYKKQKEREKNLEIKKQILSFISYFLSCSEAGMSTRKIFLSYNGEPKEFFEKVKKLEKILGIEEAVLYVSKNQNNETIKKFGIYFYLRKKALENLYENLKREIEKEEEEKINTEAKFTTINLSLTGIIPFLLLFILLEAKSLLGFEISEYSLFSIFILLFPFLKILLYLVRK
ncbi:MAG: hypothetical protein ACP5HJ_00435 [Candidatus Micrarchaeia archaeon]|jgi:archaellum biogenesis protein FlaJ (TadC family)